MSKMTIISKMNVMTVNSKMTIVSKLDECLDRWVQDDHRDYHAQDDHASFLVDNIFIFSHLPLFFPKTSRRLSLVGTIPHYWFFFYQTISFWTSFWHINEDGLVHLRKNDIVRSNKELKSGHVNDEDNKFDTINLTSHHDESIKTPKEEKNRLVLFLN